MSLSGKRVVVVGGTSGIGLSTAKAFLDESHRLLSQADLLQSYPRRKVR